MGLLRFRLDLLTPLVRLLIEVEEQGEEDDRVHQQQGGHDFWISAVEEQYLSRMEEHKRELELYSRKYRNVCFRRAVNRIAFRGKRLQGYRYVQDEGGQ